jgi:CubicO group peptidase (beta-lactamase class C family)
MKKFLFIVAFMIAMTGCTTDKQQKPIADIEIIENNLIKNVQIKGDSVKKFNIYDRMKHYNVPGVSIAVVENGKIKWAKGYGLANTKNDAKVDTETLFQAGSISKPVAALSVLKLMEDGAVELDKNVNEYLQGWQIPENEFTKDEKVTLERLLTHTAGTTVHGFPGYTQKDSFPEIIDVLNGNGNTPKIYVDTKPGTNWRYSGGGYTVMEKAVEDVSGMPLEQYMEQNFFVPLGMKNSTYEQPISEKYQQNISVAYYEDGSLIEGLWHNYPEQAAAGLWTTPTDLALYCIEVQEILKGKSDGVLSKETIEKMLTKHKNNWGLGPMLNGEKDSLVFGHGGKNAGFTNNFVAYAHLGHAVIVMTNADQGGQLAREIELGIYEYYNWPMGEPNTIDVIDIPEEELKKYTGKYELKEQDLIVELQLVDGNLYAEALGEKYTFLPVTKTRFIDIESVSAFDFILEDEKVTGFTVNRQITLKKIE